MPLELIRTKRTDNNLLQRMAIHYSQPKGFVGRNICYAIYYNSQYFGHIVAGSATRFLPGRNEYFNISIKDINHIVNNIFFNVSKINQKYPIRNFTSLIVKQFIKQCNVDWFQKYGEEVFGYETLIELPRTGELYIKAGWIKVGVTKGFTCKRIAGKGTDSWSGKRVWNVNKNELKPKLVLCYKN